MGEGGLIQSGRNDTGGGREVGGGGGEVEEEDQEVEVLFTINR